MRQALELALEALENSVDLVVEDAFNAEQLYGNYPTRQGKVGGLKVLAEQHKQAITVIKEALAQEKALQALHDENERLGLYKDAYAEPEEKKLHPVHIGVDVTREGTAVIAFYRKPDAVMEMFYSQFHPLAQPEQEPVACDCTNPWAHDQCTEEKGCKIKKKLLRTPPQRTWVGLTDEDLPALAGDNGKVMELQQVRRFAKAIEAKLKQKNGYAKEKNT